MKSIVNVWIVPTTELKKDTIDYVILWMRCKMDETNTTRIKEIVIDIMELTDSLNSKEELNLAWSQLTKAVSYLSAKDSMFKYKEELSNGNLVHV